MRGRRAGARTATSTSLTGHKLYGPTGIGVLYGKAAHLEAMPPFMGGGDMISSVTFERSTWNALPYKFEAGTPQHRRRVGLDAALDYIDSVGLDAIARARARACSRTAPSVLEAIPGVRLIGTAPQKASILSFVMDGVHPHDIGTIVDREGVAIRTGHHCAQPVMDRFGVPATARASLAMYNTREELDALGRALRARARGVCLMSDLNDLYQEVILDHNRRPRNFHALADASHRAEGYNPLCGDRLTLYLKLEDGVIREVAFRGRRVRHFEGLRVADDRRDQGTLRCPTRAALFERFHRMVTTPTDQDVEDLGKLSVARRRPRVSDAREVREPGVAHVQGGSRA